MYFFYHYRNNSFAILSSQKREIFPEYVEMEYVLMASLMNRLV